MTKVEKKKRGLAGTVTKQKKHVDAEKKIMSPYGFPPAPRRPSFGHSRTKKHI